MSVTEFNGPLFASFTHAAPMEATSWAEMYRINFLKTYRLVDGSYYRGFAPLMKRRTADGTFEYRRLDRAEKADLRSFEQQW
jgi:hypothetical protein